MGVGKRLEIGDKGLGLVPPLHGLHLLLDLFLKACAPALRAGSGTLGIAINATAFSVRTAVWAGQARVEGDLLYTDAEAFTKYGVERLVRESCHLRKKGSQTSRV